MEKDIKKNTDTEAKSESVTTKKYFFIKKFETHKKTYNIDDVCNQKNEDVIAYLLTNKIIK